MKAYKVEILIIDFDKLSEEGIETELANVRFPNDCIIPHVMDIKEAEIGEWHDDHPLNSLKMIKEEYKRLFSK